MFVITSCKETEKIEPQNYTIKGVIYHRNPYTRLKNQTFNMDVYTPGFLAEWDYIKTLGKITTNDTGYFEFTYPYQSKGTILNMSGQFFNITQNPLNTNINKKFYNSSNSTVIINLNTNNKLKANDTFFLMYRDQYAKWKLDSIYSNNQGYYKTIRSVAVNFWACAGKGKNGLKVLEDFSGFWGDPELSIVKPIVGDPFIDTVTINY